MNKYYGKKWRSTKCPTYFVAVNGAIESERLKWVREITGDCETSARSIAVVGGWQSKSKDGKPEEAKKC
jgi:hypothetical protein